MPAVTADTLTLPRLPEPAAGAVEPPAAGATQWMTAGGGILHIETPPEELVVSGGLFHGLQLWVNLPAADKMAPPRYQSLEGEQATLLTSEDGGALVRIIAGDVAGHQGPGATHTPITFLHATVAPGARLHLPWRPDFNALAYVLSGSGWAGSEGRPGGEGDLVVFGPGQVKPPSNGDHLLLRADEHQDSVT